MVVAVVVDEVGAVEPVPAVVEVPSVVDVVVDVVLEFWHPDELKLAS